MTWKQQQFVRTSNEHSPHILLDVVGDLKTITVCAYVQRTLQYSAQIKTNRWDSNKMPVLPDNEIRKLFQTMQCGQQGRCPGTHKCGMWHPADYVPDTVYHSRLRSNKGKNMDQQKDEKEKNSEPDINQKIKKPSTELKKPHQTWEEQEEREQVARIDMENEEERKRKTMKKLQSSNKSKKKLEKMVTIQEETEIGITDFFQIHPTLDSQSKEDVNATEPVNLETQTPNNDSQQEIDVIIPTDETEEDEHSASTTSTPPTLEVLTPIEVAVEETGEEEEEHLTQSDAIELELEIIEEKLEANEVPEMRGCEVENEAINGVQDSYPLTYFEKVKIRGDGLCMINSVIEVLKSKMISVTADQLIEQITDEFRCNIGQYMEFTNGLDSDPLEEIENYKKYRKYNSALADLIIPLISQTLNIRIVILELDEVTEMYNLVNRSLHIYSPETYSETIFLEKEPDHYNSLIVRRDYGDQIEQTDELNMKVHDLESPLALKTPKTTPTAPTAPPTPSPPKTPPPITQRSRRQLKLTDKMAACVENEKEKEKKKDPKNKLEKADTEGDKEGESKEVYCTCKQGDDGSKMVECYECKVWYHTKCVGLTEAKLKELNSEKKNYICQICCGKNEVRNLYEKKLLEQKHSFENMKTNLNQRMGDKNEEIKLLKRKEQQRKEGELLEKNRLKLKINKLVHELKEKNVELAEQKKSIKDNELKMKNMEMEKVPGAGSDKQLKKAKEEIRELKLSLQKMKKVLENEEEEEDGEPNPEQDVNKEDELRKQLAKSKRELKKKEFELDEMRQEKNKLLQNNLDQKQTIRHLNNSLDLLTISAVDDEVSRAKSTKTKTKMQPNSRQSKEETPTEKDTILTKEDKDNTQKADKELDKLIEKLDSTENHLDGDDDKVIEVSEEKIPDDEMDSDDEEPEECEKEREKNHSQSNSVKPIKKNSSASYKKRIKCKYYQEGNCMFGDKCWYLHKASNGNRKTDGHRREDETRKKVEHDVKTSEQPAQYGTNRKSQLVGNDCSNIKDVGDDRNKGNSYRSKKTQICKFYQQNRCQFGEDCWYVHEDEKEQERLKRLKNDFWKLDNSKKDNGNNKKEEGEDRHGRNRSSLWQKGLDKDDGEFDGRKKPKNDMVHTMKQYEKDAENMKSRIHFLEKEIKKTRRT